MAPRNNWWPPGWGCARAEGPRAWLQLHPPSPVTSTDYDTAADATETSSYFSAQGYLSSREQEGAESTSEEGQLPQVVEELKDLQVAPGTRLAKFQLKVKGER